MDLQAVERAASCKTSGLLYLGVNSHHSVIIRVPQCNTVNYNRYDLIMMLRVNIHHDISGPSSVRGKMTFIFLNV